MRRLLLTALLACATPALAQSASPQATPFKVGGMELVALEDNIFPAPNDGKTFGADVGADAVSKLLAARGLPTDKIVVGVDALLVKSGKRLLLLDTGYGVKAGGQLIASLAKAGYQPGDVTDVLLTHSHGDHILGLITADGKPAFPNATVRMTAAEWTFMQGTAGAKPVVDAIAGKVETFAPGATIAPGVVAVPITGHTPGHTGYDIGTGKTKLLDIGDTAHSSVVSLAEPGWAMGFDSDKPVARASRIALLTELAKTQQYVFAPHFPYPGVGQVVKDGAGFAWKPGLPR